MHVRSKYVCMNCLYGVQKMLSCGLLSRNELTIEENMVSWILFHWLEIPFSAGRRYIFWALIAIQLLLIYTFRFDLLEK